MGYNQQGRCKMRDPGNGDIDGNRRGRGGLEEEQQEENEWPGKDRSQFSMCLHSCKPRITLNGVGICQWDRAGSRTGSGTEDWDGWDGQEPRHSKEGIERKARRASISPDIEHGQKLLERHSGSPRAAGACRR
ncbi:hypothetical protein CMUS01_12959 [Colletotrichum musicola]|uniref:Uncharacterized protein n=1 Tax=Colletotrichum musicola TaxID=2175873 RepID=A0A8H6JGV4_9PEZI|nr:hypothetical protein CMUS01_12959 [Colletotrichum musicola]